MTVGRGRKDEIHTVVTPKDVVEYWLQAKEAQEIPRNARHPPWVHIFCGHASLEHALELDG